jgi:hypothetical protein
VYRWDSDIELKNKSHYLITNPKKELLLNKNDKIICLGLPNDNIFDTTDYFATKSSEESESDEMNSELDNSDIFNKMNKESNHVSMLGELKEEEILDRIQEEIKNIRKLSKQENIKDRSRSSFNISHNNTLNEKLLSKFHKNSDNKSIQKETIESIYKDDKETSEKINIDVLPVSIKKHIEDIMQSNSFNNKNYNISINTKNEFQGNNIISINSSSRFRDLHIEAQNVDIGYN